MGESGYFVNGLWTNAQSRPGKGYCRRKRWGK